MFINQTSSFDPHSTKGFRFAQTLNRLSSATVASVDTALIYCFLRIRIFYDFLRKKKRVGKGVKLPYCNSALSVTVKTASSPLSVL